MGFNWGGAAGGAQDALQEAIKVRMLEEDQEIKRQTVAEQAEWRKLQQQIAQQNADSLRDYRNEQIADKEQKRQGLAQRLQWAQQTVAAGMPQITDPNDIQQRVAQARYLQAQHFLDTGEELDGTILRDVLATKADPNLLSPEALEQRRGIIKYQQQMEAQFAPPRAPGAERVPWNTAKYGDKKLPTNVQAYIAQLRNKIDPETKRPYTEDRAVAEFTRHLPETLAQNPYIDTGRAMNTLRAMFRSQPTLKEELEDDALRAGMAAAGSREQ